VVEAGLASVADPARWAGPLALFLLMAVVGLELTTADFRRIAAAPRAAVGGTLSQIALLPLLCGAVLWAVEVPAAVAAGAVIVAASPPAGISNALVAVARANIALSITITAATSVLCAFTLPAFTAVGLRVFLGESSDVEVPVAPLMAQLVLSLLLPIGIGMSVRARRPDWVARSQRRIHRATLVALVVLTAIAIAFSDTGSVRLADARAGLVAAAVWTPAAMATGWGVAWILGLAREDRIVFLIGFATRNLAVATIVAMSGLGRLDLALFAGAYGAVGYPMAALAAVALRSRGAPRRGAPERG
jgi:BASS family bile acid:Na+ symporter